MVGRVPLMTDGTVVIQPVERATWPATLDSLRTQFKLPEEWVIKAQATGAESLTDLRFIWSTEEEVGNWVNALEGITNKPLVISRTRALWHAIRQQAQVREATKSRIDTADLDDMLDDRDLVDAKSKLWKRHKFDFHPKPCQRILW